MVSTDMSIRILDFYIPSKGHFWSDWIFVRPNIQSSSQYNYSPKNIMNPIISPFEICNRGRSKETDRKVTRIAYKIAKCHGYIFKMSSLNSLGIRANVV